MITQKDIKPIPKYMIAIIKREDKQRYKTSCGNSRFYAYLTAWKGELTKVTVAVRHKYRKWYCKQVAIHTLRSNISYVKDLCFYRIAGYVVGWYDVGASEKEKFFEDSVWYENDTSLFDPYAPEGSAKRCLDCKYVDTCPYSAKRLYIERWYAQKCPTDIWPYNVINTAPTTEAKIYEAMENGPYGRCAFHCDNDVVDHRIVEMAFANGVKATLTMMAFTKEMGRRMTFYGTLGEIILDEVEGFVQLRIFGGENITYQIQDLGAEGTSGYGHGGGDFYIINELYDILNGKGKSSTSLEASIESHLMGICAEESRLRDGELICVHK